MEEGGRCAGINPISAKKPPNRGLDGFRSQGIIDEHAKYSK